jgi:hypothetical protein
MNEWVRNMATNTFLTSKWQEAMGNPYVIGQFFSLCAAEADERMSVVVGGNSL